MKRALVVALAACSGSQGAAPASAPAPAPAAEPAVAAAPSAPPAYHLPDATAKALAAEPLAGQVVVAGLATLYASEAAARAHVTDAREPSRGTAMTVIADHGDVVELATKPADDCVAGFEPPYELTVFVPRAALVPRLDAGVVHGYPDGTAVAVDRGAPAWVSESGLAFEDDQLGTPDPAHLRYGITGPIAPTALPALRGERLMCENGIQTLDAWRSSRGRSDEESMRHYDDDDMRYADWCGVVDPERYGSAKTDPPVLDGHPQAWPDWSIRENSHVVRDGASYLGDVELACGRVRLRVGEAGVRHPGSGGAAGGRIGKVWTPKAGPVTWPDGRPAGTFRGGIRYRDSSVTHDGDRICVPVKTVAERVCFPAKTVTVEPDAFGGFSEVE